MDGIVVGHVTGTLGAVGPVDALGVRPLGALPEHQGRGIGSALMKATLERAAELGFSTVCLLGDPAYYGRFGFVRSIELGITSPDERWGTSFQARTVGSGVGPTGLFRYAAPFDDL